MNALVKKPAFKVVTLILLIFLTFIASLQTGAIQIQPVDVLRTLVGLGSERDALILFEFRLPRMVIALLVGAALAVSGAILQSISQNELADPGILGINTGAGLAVVIFIYFFQGSLSGVSQLTIFIMPLFAFIGAAFAAFLIYVFAWKKGITPVRLILVGIAVNAAFSALLIVIQLRMAPNDFMQATIWLTGSIWGSTWSYVLTILPWLLILVPLAVYKARTLNVMQVGTESAISLGVSMEKERRLLLILAVALAAISVAVAGGIAFLGLVAPHIARKLVGPQHQIMIPTATLVGAFILLAADMIGRNVLAPSEIPVGIVIAIIGAPYFLYLLMRTP
ncbi:MULTISPECIES: FecCD family ABC transporter permease [Bacillaceae]|uniref:Iron ABC transporter permease n=2 Tax=Bacillaceae TaxID=186817 RepID=A0A9D5DNX2_9BACI|nr:MULTISPECIES: iron ABC transporter permease [Bacillaceae]KQL56424.1 iron ABC transporter permease [Alkalicoccobacillus plakortidis]MBG9782667.1 iron ABC transporter permease [Shouchella lehensis]RQW21874.1 iron ABC transporter permease [Bacillus sp. C1-1]TES47716.1 iron ABC transporter permease [Shouchella lehensis]